MCFSSPPIWKVTKADLQEAYCRVARETLRFLERDMTAPEGRLLRTVCGQPGPRRPPGGRGLSLPGPGQGRRGRRRLGTGADCHPLLRRDRRGNFEAHRSSTCLPPRLPWHGTGIAEAELVAVLSEANTSSTAQEAFAPGPIRDEKILVPPGTGHLRTPAQVSS